MAVGRSPRSGTSDAAALSGTKLKPLALREGLFDTMSEQAQPHIRIIVGRLDALTMNLEVQAGNQRGYTARLAAGIENANAAIGTVTAKQKEQAGIVHETAPTVQDPAATVRMFAG